MFRMLAAAAVCVVVLNGTAQAVEPWYQPLRKSVEPAGPLKIWCADPDYRDRDRTTRAQCRWVYAWIQRYEPHKWKNYSRRLRDR